MIHESLLFKALAQQDELNGEIKLGGQILYSQSPHGNYDFFHGKEDG
jgi:hypothetical protein